MQEKNRSSIQFAYSFKDETSGDLWHFSATGQAAFLTKDLFDRNTDLGALMMHWF